MTRADCLCCNFLLSPFHPLCLLATQLHRGRNEAWGNTKFCGKPPPPPLGLILGLSAFPGVPRGDVGLVGDTEGIGVPWGLLSAAWDKGTPVLGLEPALGEALGSHRDRVVLGSSSSEPWLPVQAINPCQPWWVSLSPLHGCDCRVSPAHTAPGQTPSGSSGCWDDPWGCGTWNWDSLWDQPSITDPIWPREGDKFGHGFPSSDIISVFYF